MSFKALPNFSSPQLSKPCKSFNAFKTLNLPRYLKHHQNELQTTPLKTLKHPQDLQLPLPDSFNSPGARGRFGDVLVGLGVLEGSWEGLGVAPFVVTLNSVWKITVAGGGWGLLGGPGGIAVVRGGPGDLGVAHPWC